MLYAQNSNHKYNNKNVFYKRSVWTIVVKKVENPWLELTWSFQLYLEPDLSWVKVFLKSWRLPNPKLGLSSRPWVEKTWNLGKTYDWSWLDCENLGQVQVNPIFWHWGPSINKVNLFFKKLFDQPITHSHICFALKITPNYYLLMSPSSSQLMSFMDGPLDN